MAVNLYHRVGQYIDIIAYHDIKGAMRQPIQVHDFTGCEIIRSVNP